MASRKTNCRPFRLWRANVLNGAKENYIIEWTISSVNPVHGGISFLLPIWDGICYRFISALNTPGGDIFFMIFFFFFGHGYFGFMVPTGVLQRVASIRFCCITVVFFLFFFAPVRWQVLASDFSSTRSATKIMPNNHQMLNEWAKAAYQVFCFLFSHLIEPSQISGLMIYKRLEMLYLCRCRRDRFKCILFQLL